MPNIANNFIDTRLDVSFKFTLGIGGEEFRRFQGTIINISDIYNTTNLGTFDNLACDTSTK